MKVSRPMGGGPYMKWAVVREARGAQIMSYRESLSSLVFLWEKLLPFATRRDVAVTSLIGLCGIGVFWGSRSWLALTPFEKHLLKEYGTSKNHSKLTSQDDSAWIKAYTSFEEVDGHCLRVFFSPHLLFPKLPKATPLIVFVHGLGGQINQFEPLLQYFGQVADVIAVDLPGCGKSPLIDRSWDLYTTDALANLVDKVIQKRVAGRKVVLVGHSMGCMITGNLALKLGEQCLAMVLLCPRAEITEKEEQGIRIIARLPEFVYNIFRKLDRRFALGEGR